MKPDMVNHPPHYVGHPSGVECIQIVEHFGFNLGNAMKYIWRADEKGRAMEDLEKARWYIEREIFKRGGGAPRIKDPNFKVVDDNDQAHRAIRLCVDLHATIAEGALRIDSGDNAAWLKRIEDAASEDLPF